MRGRLRVGECSCCGVVDRGENCILSRVFALARFDKSITTLNKVQGHVMKRLSA